MHSTWTHQDFGDKLPSEVFREHFMTCFISDPVGVKLRHEIGVDNICWEMDYPHSDSMWPGAPEELDAVFKTYDVADDEIDKMTSPERDEAVSLRARSPTSPRARLPSARCGRPPVTTTSPFKRLSKHDKVGVNFQEWAAGAKAMSGAKD